MSHADLVIRNARIIDGTGGAEIQGDVAVKDGSIVSVGEFKGEADETLDAAGRILSLIHI